MEIQRVHTLLVTGNDDQLSDFNVYTCLWLNAIDYRGSTMRFTCMDDDLPWAVQCADAYSLTLQEIVYVDNLETYPVLVQGNMPGWGVSA